MLSNERRSVLHFGITDHPTAEWTAQQIVEVFPYDTAPKYVLRDRDKIYGSVFRRWFAGMGIEKACTAPRSPWQNPYVERLIGAIRRECLHHLVILNTMHLHRILQSSLIYYNKNRTHISLDRDAPESREKESSEKGEVYAIPMLEGFHRHINKMDELIEGTTRNVDDPLNPNHCEAGEFFDLAHVKDQAGNGN